MEVKKPHEAKVSAPKRYPVIDAMVRQAKSDVPRKPRSGKGTLVEIPSFGNIGCVYNFAKRR